MNPYVMLGSGVVVLALVGGAGFEGRRIGIDVQKADDQAQFDQYNTAIAKQKADAARIMQDAQAQIIALQGQRDALKTNLENQYAVHQAETRALSARYAGLQLRFRTQDPGRGDGSSGTVPAGTDAAGTPSAAVVQLPAEITGNLRQLALDADNLRDAYAKCYAWAEQVK
jgi:hypothetical protein